MKRPDKFILDFYNLENDIFFNQLFDTGEAIYTFNKTVTGNIWNHAFPYNIDGKSEEECELKYRTFLQETIAFFLSKKRKPAVYLDDKYFSTKMLDILYENHFERFDNEAWMRLKKIKKEAVWDYNLKVLHIDDISKYDDFGLTVAECFSPEYAIELKEDFGKNYGFKKIEHFTFYDGEILIGAGSVYYDKKTAHIHNVSVLPQYRRHGYGSCIVKNLFNYTKQQLKINNIILQCDGVTVEEFYTRLGAETFYRRYGYILNVDVE